MDNNKLISREPAAAPEPAAEQEQPREAAIDYDMMMECLAQEARIARREGYTDRGKILRSAITTLAAQRTNGEVLDLLCECWRSLTAPDHIIPAETALRIVDAIAQHRAKPAAG